MKQKTETLSLPLIRQWLSVLDELRQENIILKNRLSEAVSRSMNRSFIEVADVLLQHSVDKDQVIDLLRHDIAGLMVKIKREDAPAADVMLDKQLQTLGGDVDKIVTGFRQMKQDFEQYLSGRGTHDPK